METEAAFVVEADEDARLLYREQNTARDSVLTETAPLLPETTPEPDDGLDRPWLGSSEFARKPAWRRPSVWWIVFPLFLFTTAYGGIVVPRVNLILSLVCRDYFAERASKDPTFTYLPVVLGDNNDQCSIPEVQAGSSQFLLYINLISGLLSAIVSPRLGHLSDRYGRTLLLSLCVFGTLVAEAFTAYVAAKIESAPISLLLVGAFFDGVCGSFTLALALAHSYGADCSSPERRNVVFGFFHATLFGGIAIGPFLFGLLIKLTGSIIVMFYTVLCFHGIYFVVLLFIIPESLSKERQQAAKQKHRTKQLQYDHSFLKSLLIEINPVNIFTPLKILFPTIDNLQSFSFEERTMFKSLRRNLILIASIDTLIFGVAMGTMQIIILYAEYMFGWHNFETSIFISITNITRVITLLVILPMVTRLIRGPQQSTQTNSGSDRLDITCIQLAILFELLGYIGYSLSRSGAVFQLSAVVASLGGMGSPTLQSSITKHVPASRTGEILGATGLLHALARVISPIIFNLIYSATVGKFTQTVFVCLASVFGLAALLSFFIVPGVYLPATPPASREPESTEDVNIAD
ncbi:putative tetracycline-efflux transporter [Talaromyces proteolyticus]|uniref:Tetracycline-efflux transporter n=1 Tax=Talaromyces proteolyticus TaxID=1131652 RepID=A0AAD4KXM5_9EURO|nr:putative tetracycline-efflux transporter [Talaromyces proteolyticus]KAH8702414.1 putative tetracycline-efflux transporter [Talaromyces proteolyticus]